MIDDAFTLEPSAFNLQLPYSQVHIDAWGDGYPWPVGDILDWLEILANTIHDWLDGLWGAISNGAWGVAAWINNARNDLWGIITNPDWGVLSWITAARDGLWNNISNGQWGVLSWIA